MKALLAIAGLAMRAAIRSRVVACLLIVLVLAVIGLPLTVKGDGTIDGYVQILLSYTLGFSVLVLSIATVWAGCAAIATEVSTKRIQMIAVKPVPRWTIWLGKWVGLLAVNTVLLGAVAGGAYGLLRWKTRDSQLAAGEGERLRQEILIARRPVDAEIFDISREKMLAKLEERKRRGEVAEGAPLARELDRARREALTSAYSVGPGGRLRFTFTTAGSVTGWGRPAMKYRFVASQMEAFRAAGQWALVDETGRTVWSTNINALAVTPREMPLPLEPLTKAGRIEMHFINTDPRGLTIIFDPQAPPQLLLPAGSFEANYARAMGILWIQLAFLAAVGLFASSLFSMPVASFVALGLVVMLHSAAYVESLSKAQFLLPWHQVSAAPQPSFGDDLFRVFFRGLALVLGPLQEPDPLALLSAGGWVGGDWVLRAAATKLIVYSGILSVLAAWILHRRELALPTDT